MKQTLLLAVLDGLGIAPAGPDNAVACARTPHLDELMRDFPTAQLACSGLAVGLPEGQMGNSEVGHVNIGAGRVVYQELTRISKEIADGAFDQNPSLRGALDHAKAHGGAVHVYGLLSDGGVHSHISHLEALLRLCGAARVPVYLHCFLDGRDVSPTSGAGFVEHAQQLCAQTGARIASVCGRFYAMDRDNRWDRVERAYRAVALGDAPYKADPVQGVRASYEAGVTDEFVEPFVCLKDVRIGESDSVIFYNFRPDRARELTRVFVDPAFSGFARAFAPPYYVCFTQYDAAMPNVRVAFEPQSLHDIFGEYIANRGLTQLRIAETEKYAHVTFFFNGGREAQFPGEDRILVPSPKVATYDLQPEMSAVEVTDRCCEAIRSGKYDVIVLNLANCDMVGHTGVFDAAVRAVETVDACVGRLVEALSEIGGTALITADHGNADVMRTPEGDVLTSHSMSPVPVILTRRGARLKDGALCDIAPTLLALLDLPKPAAMTGESLLA